MKEVILAFFVGLLIGIIFKFVKLPVPVPHGLAGLVGLIGMFVGANVLETFTNFIAKK